jgi:hypothetical protein
VDHKQALDYQHCCTYFMSVRQVLTITARIALRDTGSRGCGCDGSRSAGWVGEDENAAESEDVEGCKKLGEHFVCLDEDRASGEEM